MLTALLPILLLASQPASVSPALCRPGSEVEVHWGARWWPAHVTAGVNASGRCPITYDGYDRSWDEAVSAERVRPRPGVVAPPPAAPPPPAPPPAPARTGPAADRWFTAPAGRADLAEFAGRPLWVLLGGCARGYWVDAQQAATDVTTATEQELARQGGTTVQALRAQRAAAANQQFTRYGNMAANRLIVDRGVSRAQALTLLGERNGVIHPGPTDVCSEFASANGRL